MCFAMLGTALLPASSTNFTLYSSIRPVCGHAGEENSCLLLLAQAFSDLGGDLDAS